ncbi:MAG: hypothetical protein AB8U44_00220 [Aaplasma endosymbiont of Hyalomma asiaticum]
MKKLINYNDGVDSQNTLEDCLAILLLGTLIIYMMAYVVMFVTSGIFIGQKAIKGKMCDCKIHKTLSRRIIPWTTGNEGEKSTIHEAVWGYTTILAQENLPYVFSAIKDTNESGRTVAQSQSCLATSQELPNTSLSMGQIMSTDQRGKTKQSSQAFTSTLDKACDNTQDTEHSRMP